MGGGGVPMELKIKFKVGYKNNWLLCDPGSGELIRERGKKIEKNCLYFGGGGWS